MILLRRLMYLVTAVALLVSVTLAQGPKKDVGNKVPLPATPPPMDKNAPPQKSDLPRVDSLSIDVDLVNVDVVVTDNSGNPIGGLTKSQFKIFDDNVEQNITNFSPTDAPLTIVLLLEFGDTFGYYADDVVQPAAGFIGSLRPEDWAALVAYDVRPEILTDFTKNKNDLFNGLRRLRIPAYRETCLYDAVWDTLQRLEGVDGKKAIFLVSTGLDTISKHSYPETLKKAETGDTMIYSISMGQSARLYYESIGAIGPETNIGFLQADNVLRSFAELSGGTAFYPKFQGEFRSIFETVSAHLRNQYSLGFVPTNRKADGKQHKIRVEVPPLDVNRDGKLDKLKVKHKRGYYAPKS
jgi:Ca-activated chloride channel homolog